MSKLITALTCLMLAASPLALAQEKSTHPTEKKHKQEPSEKQKAQQQRMKSCNARAADKKLEGDARRKFMSECLGGDVHIPTEKQKAQQDRMRACNARAADKKLEGDARKKFMSQCLKG